jgi:hypothetical protein
MTTSSSVLGPFDTPPSKLELMRVWHTNTEDPCTSRQSVVPISSETHIEEANTEAEEEDFEATAPVSNTVPVQSKRRQGNDSVSPNSND